MNSTCTNGLTKVTCPRQLVLYTKLLDEPMVFLMSDYIVNDSVVVTYKNQTTRYSFKYCVQPISSQTTVQKGRTYSWLTSGKRAIIGVNIRRRSYLIWCLVYYIQFTNQNPCNAYVVNLYVSMQYIQSKLATYLVKGEAKYENVIPYNRTSIYGVKPTGNAKYDWKVYFSLFKAKQISLRHN